MVVVFKFVMQGINVINVNSSDKRKTHPLGLLNHPKQRSYFEPWQAAKNILSEGLLK